MMLEKIPKYIYQEHLKNVNIVLIRLRETKKKKKKNLLTHNS